MVEEGDFVSVVTATGTVTGHVMYPPGAKIWVETDDGDIMECDPGQVTPATGHDVVAAETERLLAALRNKSR